MSNTCWRRLAILFLFAAGANGFSVFALAGEVRIAVASNFSDVMKEIAQPFEARTGYRVKLSPGSTGKHYAQIKNGAPFDLFFAADSERPKRLEVEGIAQPGSRFTYAIGKVVLWSPDKALVDKEGKILHATTYRYLAIANARLAPYGRAAEQVLKAEGIWDNLQPRIVRGENIGQAFQYVQSGNAELGFVAYSQLRPQGKLIEGSFWEPPLSLYDPIEQQAVLIRDTPEAREFIAYFRQPEIRKLLQNHGYESP